MSTRFYTVQEANDSLPLVRRIVQDIIQTWQAMDQLVTIGGEKALDSPEFAKLKKSLAENFDELQELGVEFKDWNFEIGLIDFPAMIDGEEVYLCWHSGEDTVSHFHGMSLFCFCQELLCFCLCFNYVNSSFSDSA